MEQRRGAVTAWCRLPRSFPPHLRYAREPLEGALLIVGDWIIGVVPFPFVTTTGDTLEAVAERRRGCLVVVRLKVPK